VSATDSSIARMKLKAIKYSPNALATCGAVKIGQAAAQNIKYY
jgi:hypothetical protein